MRSTLATCVILAACHGSSPTPLQERATPPSSASAPPARADFEEEGPLRMETLQPVGEPPVFVMRGGAPRGNARLVFLHGMCGHGLGYAQAFQRSAARFGTLIAPQGDVSCGDVWSKWSGDIDALDRRIRETFTTLGLGDRHEDVWIMGMSQGATRAAALARKWPKRYTRLVSIAAPTSIARGDLRGLAAAVLMAGERDRRDLMQASERALKQTGVPALFLIMPGESHGAMGDSPEKTMAEALAFLSDHGPA